jgi:hypothetical protein
LLFADHDDPRKQIGFVTYSYVTVNRNCPLTILFYTNTYVHREVRLMSQSSWLRDQLVGTRWGSQSLSFRIISQSLSLSLSIVREEEEEAARPMTIIMHGKTPIL